jgi:hypothetical protein
MSSKEDKVKYAETKAERIVGGIIKIYDRYLTSVIRERLYPRGLPEPTEEAADMLFDAIYNVIRSPTDETKQTVLNILTTWFGPKFFTSDNDDPIISDLATQLNVFQVKLKLKVPQRDILLSTEEGRPANWRSIGPYQKGYVPNKSVALPPPNPLLTKEQQNQSNIQHGIIADNQRELARRRDAREAEERRVTEARQEEERIAAEARQADERRVAEARQEEERIAAEARQADERRVAEEEARINALVEIPLEYLPKKSITTFYRTPRITSQYSMIKDQLKPIIARVLQEKGVTQETAERNIRSDCVKDFLKHVLEKWRPDFIDNLAHVMVLGSNAFKSDLSGSTYTSKTFPNCVKNKQVSKNANTLINDTLSILPSSAFFGRNTNKKATFRELIPMINFYLQGLMEQGYKLVDIQAQLKTQCVKDLIIQYLEDIKKSTLTEGEKHTAGQNIAFFIKNGCDDSLVKNITEKIQKVYDTQRTSAFRVNSLALQKVLKIYYALKKKINSIENEIGDLQNSLDATNPEEHQLFQFLLMEGVVETETKSCWGGVCGKKDPAAIPVYDNSTAAYQGNSSASNQSYNREESTGSVSAVGVNPHLYNNRSFDDDEFYRGNSSASGGSRRKIARTHKGRHVSRRRRRTHVVLRSTRVARSKGPSRHRVTRRTRRRQPTRPASRV